ncbi:mesoderm induction early response protein isoform X1 [Tasmannia lanceolata]|uniref:mesoderm induction early response protein isoform X1 n=1 Tax=Tasmannia lanceolata TaxID=3420 RepID=UPI0040627C6A
MSGDENEGEETSTRGNEWEVVTLTASTYAAAPNVEGFEPTDDDKDKDLGRDEESSHAMLMSHHFVFPPSEHENLPLEPDNSEIHIETAVEDVGSTQAYDFDVEEGDIPKKSGLENLNIKGISEADELPGIQYFDEKGKSLSGHRTEFEEVKAMQGLHLDEEEQIIYSAAEFSSFHGEADISGPAAPEENTTAPESNVPSQLSLDSPSDFSENPEPTKENKNNGSGLPCEAWWKRRAASIYSNAKEANAFWSVVVAAAVMGLVILGQQWQQERWQVQQLKWKFCINDEKINRLLGPISRFKDVLVGGQRRGPITRGSSSADN